MTVNKNETYGETYRARDLRAKIGYGLKNQLFNHICHFNNNISITELITSVNFDPKNFADIKIITNLVSQLENDELCIIDKETTGISPTEMALSFFNSSKNILPDADSNDEINSFRLDIDTSGDFSYVGGGSDNYSESIEEITEDSGERLNKIEYDLFTEFVQSLNEQNTESLSIDKLVADVYDANEEWHDMPKDQFADRAFKAIGSLEGKGLGNIDEGGKSTVEELTDGDTSTHALRATDKTFKYYKNNN